LEARHAGRRRRWTAAGPQRPAYSGRGHIVSPRAQLVGAKDEGGGGANWS